MAEVDGIQLWQDQMSSRYCGSQAKLGSVFMIMWSGMPTGRTVPSGTPITLMGRYPSSCRARNREKSV